MKNKWEFGYTFDDVLIKPKFSEMQSRKIVNLRSNISQYVSLELPVISANMATLTGLRMAEAMAKGGGLGILHRFMDFENNIHEFKALEYQQLGCGVSIGLGPIEQNRANALIEVGAKIICIDVAHGATQMVVNQYRYLRDKYGSKIVIIVGNFADAVSLLDFLNRCGDSDSWPDAIKIGIGPGSVCTTRVKTGIGVPQLSAIIQCTRAVDGNTYIIADGGMRNPGDIAKAIAAGANAVMLGGMLAGTNESAGGTTYRGSAANGYGEGWKTAEGVEAVVSPKGPVSCILKDIEGGLRSALTYTGSRNLEEFRQNAKFIRVSSSTKYESMAHLRGEIRNDK